MEATVEVPKEIIGVTEMVNMRGEIFRLQDVDISLPPVHVLSLRNSAEGQKILDGIYGENRWVIAYEKLTNEQERRIKEAREILALPDTLAVFYALDTDYSPNDFKKPKPGTTAPVLVALAGESSLEKGGKGVGKSTITAILSERNDWPILDFENLYWEKAGNYARILKESNWNHKDINGAVQILNKVWGDKVKKTPVGELRPLRTALNEALQLFMNTKERPPLYLCDMPGFPGKTRSETGEVVSTRRKSHVYDFFSSESMPLGFINLMQVPTQGFGGKSLLEKKIEWMENTLRSKL